MESRLTVRLPPDIDHQLSAAAARLGLRKSDVVRLALAQYLERTADRIAVRPYIRVKTVVGVVASGTLDLGAQHTKHLLERFSRA